MPKIVNGMLVPDEAASGCCGGGAAAKPAGGSCCAPPAQNEAAQAQQGSCCSLESTSLFDSDDDIESQVNQPLKPSDRNVDSSNSIRSVQRLRMAERQETSALVRVKNTILKSVDICGFQVPLILLFAVVFGFGYLSPVWGLLLGGSALGGYLLTNGSGSSSMSSRSGGSRPSGGRARGGRQTGIRTVKDLPKLPRKGG